jgi:large subunit ribosomal protein L25
VSDNIALALTKREATGKKVAGLRASGQIPGVVYGHDFAATNVQAPEVKFAKVVSQAGKHHLVDLDIDGKKEMGLIKSIDIDPVKNTIRHVAFHIVKQDEAVETDVPIKLVGEGESEAERAGLVVLQSLETLKIRALPKDLPDSLDVSILTLAEPGQGVTIGDLTIPKGVELVEENMEITIASVYEPSALAAANDAAGGDAEEETEVPAEEGSEEAIEGETKPEDGSEPKADAEKNEKS